MFDITIGDDNSGSEEGGTWRGFCLRWLRVFCDTQTEMDNFSRFDISLLFNFIYKVFTSVELYFSISVVLSVCLVFIILYCTGILCSLLYSTVLL